MAYCDRCGNFDESHRESMEYPKDSRHCIQDYQPELYYYWDSPIEEDYSWRDAVPHADCLCEICFDILNIEGNIKWVDDKNPFECASINSGTQGGCFLIIFDYHQYIQTTHRGF